MVGHLLRHGGLLKSIIEVASEGKIPKGILRRKFMKDIMDDMVDNCYGTLEKSRSVNSNIITIA